MMRNRRRLMIFNVLKENLIEKATYLGMVVLQTVNHTLANSTEKNGVFIIPIESGKTYRITKTENIGAVFRTGFTTKKPTKSNASGMQTYNFIANTTNETITTTAPDNCSYLVIQAHGGSTDGDIHEQMQEILEVIEV